MSLTTYSNNFVKWRHYTQWLDEIGLVETSDIIFKAYWPMIAEFSRRKD